MTEEEKRISKENASKKRSESMKRYWANISEQERINRGMSIKIGINNMSDEDKLRRSINSSNATKKVMESLSDEERKERSLKLSNANRMRYKNMSENERKVLGSRISEGQRNRSEEDRIASNKRRSESLKNYIRNLSPQEIQTRNQKVQDWWNNMTKEEFQKWNENRAAGYSNYIIGLNIFPNSTESIFIESLERYSIAYQYQYYNKIKHPDFDILFPSNPVNGSNFINPFHQWDFLVHTYEKDVLVDIDGSIHFHSSYEMTHPFTGIKYNMFDYIKFNDSQRPYQTDGLDAYIIECPNNVLNNKNEVLDISNNSVISFETLISKLTGSLQNITNS